MKIRSSTKLLIGGILVAGGLYFGYQAYAGYQVDSLKFSGVKPGHITVCGFRTGEGFMIIVSNQRAQLVQSDGAGKFGVDMSKIDKESDSGDKPRVPMKDMMEALQGNEEASGKLTVAMNSTLRKQELPPLEVIWKADDIQKALDGDKVLTTKLEQDLNVRLDGTPLAEVRPASLQNGIVIEARVPVEALVGNEVKTLMSPIHLFYQPYFVSRVNDRYKEIFSPTRNQILGYYMEEMARAKKAGDKEDVAGSLRSRISQTNLKDLYAASPTTVLKNAQIVLNESFMTSARIRESDQGGIHSADLIINLSDEGRKRLWQYSRRNPGIQLLLVKDGIAVSAPKVNGEIPFAEVTFRGVTNVSLAQETVDDVNKYAKSP